MNSKTVPNLVSLYKEWSAVPSAKWAAIYKKSAGDLCVQSKWGTCNISMLERTSFNKSYLFKDGTFSVVGFPTDSSDEKLTSISKSGKLRAVIRKTIEKRGVKRQYLEVWKEDSLWNNWDLAALDIHGDVNDDGQFGCLEWSPDERQLVYVAEKKQPKSVSFFSQKLELDKPAEDQEVGFGQYREEWGEQLVGKHHPVACILDIYQSEIIEVDLGNKSCGKVIWGPQGESLICVGWEEEPRRLGIIFCPNRKSALYQVDLKNGNTVQLLHDCKGWASLCPRLSPDNKNLVFLEESVMGPHRSCFRLCKMDWATKNVEITVDIVDKAIGQEFPGLYCDMLNSNCFSRDGKHLLVTSYWRSKQEIICINIKNSEVKRLTKDPKIGSWTFLDMVDNMVIAACCAPDLKSHLVFADLGSFFNDGHDPKWVPFESIDPKILGISWKILELQPKSTEDKSHSFEAVLMTPPMKNGQKYPLIVVPHGGPHSMKEAGFFLNYILYVKLGFAIVTVNYRGSLGFGDNVLRSLLGKVGDMDVKDCQQTVEEMLQQDWVDSERIVISGGSHGGFLAAHLIGQYPDTYRACICFNPVVDISGKLDGTDIPDWGYAESGQQDKFEFSVLPSPEKRKIMWDCSPYQYINQVKTPLLFCIGQNDLRVPPSQGINYHHTLKAMGKVTQLYLYKDNHSLSGLKVSTDCFIREAQWIFQHLGMYP